MSDTTDLIEEADELLAKDPSLPAPDAEMHGCPVDGCRVYKHTRLGVERHLATDHDSRRERISDYPRGEEARE